MAQITGLPKWSRLQVSGSLGSRPRTSASSFGGDGWKQIEDLGNQVTRAAVTTMQHYIQNDHRRQQDEAKEDLLYYSTEQQRRVDELKQKKLSDAFNTPQEYLEQMDERKAQLEELRAVNDRGGGLNNRGGQIYRQMLAEGQLRIDQHNIQSLNKHVLSERTNLTVTMSEATNAHAVEVIKREPWRLTEQLTEVIFPNISDQVEAQGYGTEIVGTGASQMYMADYMKQQASIAAVKSAVDGLAEQYGPEEALKFFNSSDVETLQGVIGKKSWDEIFGAVETKLKAQQDKEITNTIGIQLDREVSERLAAGDNYLTVRDEMMVKYGPTLGVSSVNSVLQSVVTAQNTVEPKVQKQLQKDYLGLLMSGQASFETLQATADGDVDKARALDAAYKEYQQLDTTKTTFRTNDILNSKNSVIAQDIRSGRFDEASQTAFKLYEDGDLTRDEYSVIAKSINDTRALYDPEAVADNEVQKRLDRAVRDENLRNAELNVTNQETLTRVLESGAGKNSKAYQEASFETKQFLNRELDARYQGRFESDENIRQRNFYRYDSVPTNQLLQMMSTEVGMSQIARDLGGESSTQFKELYKKLHDPARGMSYLTNATVEARNRVRARAIRRGEAIDNAEFNELRPVIDDAVTELFNSYQADHNLESPNMIPPTVRNALINTVVDRTALERGGVAVNRDNGGTTIENSVMENLNPELYAKSIKVAIPHIPSAADYAGSNPGNMEFAGSTANIPMHDEVPPVWTFKRHPQTGVETYVQENIPYVIGVTGHDGVQRIATDARQFDNAGRLTYFPSYNMFVLYSLTGKKLQSYNMAGKPIDEGY